MQTSAISALLRETPVMVTGLGVFSAAGCGIDEFFQSIVLGKGSARFSETHPQREISCPAPHVNTGTPPLRSVRKMDRSVQMAIVAVQEAWSQAKLRDSTHDPKRVSVFLGTSRGPAGKTREADQDFQESRSLPTHAPNSTLACLSGAISMGIGAEGTSLTVSATCSSASHAIALGAQQILLGLADIVVVGGAEAPLLPSIIGQMNAAGVLGQHEEAIMACRPFSSRRNGTVLGEGAAVLVLESACSARKRGVTTLARLSGWFLGTDSGQRTGIRDDGKCLQECMVKALEMAQLNPDQIGYLHAHGTGTSLNDHQEAHAINTIFPHGVPCSSTKAVTGHCMGASGAMGAIVGILAMRRGLLPPSANCHPIDPKLAIDLIHPVAHARKVEAVMINSAGFWGSTSSLIFNAS